MATSDMTTDGDRRQATVMFADLAGFTALSQTMDPEDVTDTMNGCFRIIERVVLDRGGSVDKFIGDCAMALFGAPQALEDAPRCAINAAIEIRNRLGDYLRSRRLYDRVDIHIGINTGLVVAGDVGGRLRRDYTVMGPTVNVASRLLGVAARGQIMVGTTTYRHTFRDFQYRPTKPLKLKDIDEPAVVYELLSRNEQLHRPAPSTSADVGAPIVGRKRELSLLDGVFRALRDGRGSIVSVVAEPGLGKSRLVAEARKLESAADLALYEGRSMSIGQALRFHPFVDLLSHWAGVSGGPEEAVAAQSFSERVHAVCGEEANEVYPFLARLMGYDLDASDSARLAGIEGDALEKLIRRAVRRFIELLSARTPVVLIFEDLHWADRSSLGMLEYLLDLAESHAVSFVQVARPQYEATSEKVLKAARTLHASCHTEIRLEPLEDRNCERLVRHLLGAASIPPAVFGLVARKTEGNPFYVEEVLSSMRDAGVLRVEKDAVVVRGDLEGFHIPGSIEEIVMARVDRLPIGARQVLQVASIIGRRFYRRILEEVAPDPTDLDANLSLLVERKFLTDGVSHRTASTKRLNLSGEVEYAFKHVVIQQAVYESLLKRTRRDLHARCARAMERLFADRLHDAYGMLAYHWSQTDELDKAEDYLFKAGQEAARSAASHEALQYFQEAYRVYLLHHGEAADKDKKAILENSIGTALLNTGNLAESIDHFNEALRLWGIWVPKGELAQRVQLATVLPGVLAHLYLGSKKGARFERPHDVAIYTTMYNRCRAQNPTDPKRAFFDNIATMRYLRRVNPDRVVGAAGMYAANGAFFAFAGLSQRVARRFLEASESLSRPDRPSDRFQHLAMATIVDFHAGDWSGKHDIDAKLWEAGLRSGLFWDADVYLCFVCERALRQGRFALAETYLHQIEDLIRNHGYGFSESTRAAMAAYLLLEQRRLDEARTAMQVYRDARYEEPLRVFALAGLARIETLAGRLEAAADSLDEARTIVERSTHLPAFYAGAYWNSRLRFDLALLEADRIGRRQLAADTKATLGTARLIARDAAEAQGLIARIYWLRSDHRRALESWQRALDLAERLDMRPELARVHRDIGLALANAPPAHRTFRDADSEQWLDRARNRFAEMGLESELEALDSQARPLNTRRSHA